MAKLIGQVLRQALLKLESGQPRGDAELLERFAVQGDEAAFAELVRLHGPMVWRVCQRVLRQTQDAEDAFQATFVVLARKAGSLAQRHLLGGWLHGVAYRVSLAARKVRGRRDSRRQPLVDEPSAPAKALGIESDWHGVLDEEIARLPARYRLPLVLCDLQGKTSEEAARELAIPAGTVRRRLAHIRDRLRARLARRGVHFSAAALPAVLAQEASAMLPTTLAGAALRAASVVAAGQAASTVLAPTVVALVRNFLAADAYRRAGRLVLCGLFLLLGLGAISWLVLLGQPALSIPAEAIQVRTVLPHNDFVYRVAFAPNSKSLYCSSFDGQVKRWDAATGQQLPQSFKEVPFSLAVSPDGKTLAAGSWCGTVQLWDTDSGRELVTFLTSDFVPETDSWAINIGLNESLQESQRLVRAGGTTAVAFSPDGLVLAVGREKYPKICLYDLATLRQPKPGQKRYSVTGSVSLMPGGLRPWSATVMLLPPDRVLTHDRPLRSPAFSPDGRTLAAAGLREVVLWDMATGQVRGALNGHQGTITSLQFAPNGKTLLTAGMDGCVKLWHPESLQERAAWDCRQGFVYEVAVAPNGRFFATVGSLGTVKLWDLRTGQNLAVLQHSTERASTIAFAPDGQTLASGGFDKNVKLWNLSNPK